MGWCFSDELESADLDLLRLKLAAGGLSTKLKGLGIVTLATYELVEAEGPLAWL